jgi:epoxyqueuosine reductase
LTTLKIELRQRARDLGFDACYITRPSAIADARPRLERWLAEGSHGDMVWMANSATRRSDPRKLWHEARSIVMLAVNYGPAEDPLATLARKSRGNISVYARHRDYHDLIKGRLKVLARWLIAAACERQPQAHPAVKVFVDTAPVMEKPLAQAAGIGWQGKHTNLVSRQFGSWLFLGSLFTTLDLVADTPEQDHCGSCRACLDICPTAAFPAPYRLDARRCISYLTIEHKGPIPLEFRAAIGNRIYGCDDCLAVCPWNKFAEHAREAKLQALVERIAPALCDLARLTEPAFRERFSGSPIKRIGHERFIRNVLIAVGNSQDSSLRDVVLERLVDSSPLIRATAVWAAAQLWPKREWIVMAERFGRAETDPDVIAEWQHGPPEASHQ